MPNLTKMKKSAEQADARGTSAASSVNFPATMRSQPQMGDARTVSGGESSPLGQRHWPTAGDMIPARGYESGGGGRRNSGGGRGY